MNDKAKKKARQAELEYILLGVFYRLRSDDTFADWLEWQASEKMLYENSCYEDEAKELIALYEEG